MWLLEWTAMYTEKTNANKTETSCAYTYITPLFNAGNRLITRKIS